jgi:hypothetical protein
MTNIITERATQPVIPTQTATVAPNYFSRKIGNTTFVVFVSFNEKATESMSDKIMRLVASDIMQKEDANAV